MKVLFFNPEGKTLQDDDSDDSIEEIVYTEAPMNNKYSEASVLSLRQMAEILGINRNSLHANQRFLTLDLLYANQWFITVDDELWSSDKEFSVSKLNDSRIILWPAKAEIFHIASKSAADIIAAKDPTGAPCITDDVDLRFNQAKGEAFVSNEDIITAMNPTEAPCRTDVRFNQAIGEEFVSIIYSQCPPYTMPMEAPASIIAAKEAWGEMDLEAKLQILSCFKAANTLHLLEKKPTHPSRVTFYSVSAVPENEDAGESTNKNKNSTKISQV